MLRREPPRNILSTAAAQTVADNDDLLLEILLRLPIQSLQTFESVSKRWLSLISDPNFSHRRTNFHLPTPSGIFLRSPCPNSSQFDFIDLRTNPSRPLFESLDFSLPKHGIAILQSCNGLLLCCNKGLSLTYTNSDFYIYNPTTKQYATLPKVQTKNRKIRRTRAIVGLNLAFDPLRSSSYKVISVRIFNSKNYGIEIYSPDSGTWRSCPSTFAAPFNTRFDRGVYWNGGVHWINWENSLYLDLREEKVHEMPFPRVRDGWSERRVEYFGECRGHLHLIETYGPDQGVELNVCEMEDDRGGWFLKYRVDLQCVSDLFLKVSPSEENVMNLMMMGYPKFRVLAIVDQSRSEESYVVLQIVEKVVRVNVKSGSFEKLVCILNNGGGTSAHKFSMGFGHIDAFLYFESLAGV